ncbi:hypothetical protein NSB25_08455 [Acetatifactor muris]|nr:hypothetical protein [Acetatifactor muris]MCI8799232.1 hypothetical protein [Lachnospiraceae bacterium]MCR2047306.1 hypothetical protein [Acetatifactor muris]
MQWHQLGWYRRFSGPFGTEDRRFVVHREYCGTNNSYEASFMTKRKEEDE